MVKVVVLIEWKGSISYLFQVGIIRYEKHIIGCFFTKNITYYQRHDYIVMVILCIDEYQNI